ncbi:MAG: hypothetical protein L6290_10815, partial [Thermodesulfovibrionales bacterium]|nr:hypothetical protein [Thermodesulfovibrionales bacterium]
MCNNFIFYSCNTAINRMIVSLPHRIFTPPFDNRIISIKYLIDYLRYLLNIVSSLSRYAIDKSTMTIAIPTSM